MYLISYDLIVGTLSEYRFLNINDTLRQKQPQYLRTYSHNRVLSLLCQKWREKQITEEMTAGLMKISKTDV